MELPKPKESYINPNIKARQRALGKISLLAVIGPTASGKTTLMHELKSSSHRRFEFRRVIGHTNRPIRKNETNGVDYHFVSTKKMKKMHRASEFLQLETTPAGDTYGTKLDAYVPAKPKSDTELINMFAVMAQAMTNFREYGFKEVKPVFMVPYSHNFWLELLEKQDIEESKRKSRCIEAISSYEFALSDEDTRFILNYEIPDAAQRVIHVVKDEKIWDEEQAKQIAGKNLKDLIAYEKRL